MISNYESRFLQVRSIIEKQDAEVKTANASLTQVRENLVAEEDKSRKLQEKIDEMKREFKSEISQANLRAEESSEELSQRYSK